MVQSRHHRAARSHEMYHRALEAHDRRFDGVFFVGISTTGIYCRPVCPSRQANPAHRCFFPSAAAAEAAGLVDQAAFLHREFLELAVEGLQLGAGQGELAGGLGVEPFLALAALEDAEVDFQPVHQVEPQQRADRGAEDDGGLAIEAGISPLDGGCEADLGHLTEQNGLPVHPSDRQLLKVFQPARASQVPDQVFAGIQLQKAAAAVAGMALRRRGAYLPRDQGRRHRPHRALVR